MLHISFLTYTFSLIFTKTNDLGTSLLEFELWLCHLLGWSSLNLFG